MTFAEEELEQSSESACDDLGILVQKQHDILVVSCVQARFLYSSLISLILPEVIAGRGSVFSFDLIENRLEFWRGVC